LFPPDGHPAIFLDRDGILNDLVFYPDTGEWESPRSAADLRIVPGAGVVLRALAEKGWPLFLVSNQPSFAKGKTSLEALLAVHDSLLAYLAGYGVHLTKAYYCFHHPKGVVPGFDGPCSCRKPSPHFLLQAASRFGLDLSASWMVGDQDLDLLCARNAGCRSILIPCAVTASKRGGVAPDQEVADLASLPECLRFLDPCDFPPRSSHVQ
jgi:D-glycero-D-manno-heptose 1,7-bisphosphate phosphatase